MIKKLEKIVLNERKNKEEYEVEAGFIRLLVVRHYYVGYYRISFPNAIRSFFVNFQFSSAALNSTNSSEVRADQL